MAIILINKVAMGKVGYKLALVIALISVVAMSGCRKENQCHIPIGDANCAIDLTMPDTYPLWHNLGMVKIIGGYKGIWITNNGGEYIALEAACPIDNETAVIKDKDWENVLICPKCKSQFISLTGMPVDGSATQCPLRAYSVYREGNTLYVSN